MGDLWATDTGRAMMADYLDRLGNGTTTTLGALLFLHENPQELTGRFLSFKERNLQMPKWKRMEKEGFITHGYERKRRKANATYTLADENVTWLLVEILELIVRRIEKERFAARALLRYAALGTDRGQFDQVLATDVHTVRGWYTKTDSS